jgi:methylated-DNA-[protein]-cysteine S-methyltransferase
MAKVYFDSPIGIFEVVADNDAVISVDIVEKAGMQATEGENGSENAFECARQLKEYLSGKRKKFSVHLRPSGTPFQQKIWSVLNDIPFGSTLSYGGVAMKAGNPRGSRATGQAVGRNPILIITPCHRVIASDGGIGGFSGGLWRKEWLLAHESMSSGRK